VQKRSTSVTCPTLVRITQISLSSEIFNKNYILSNLKMTSSSKQETQRQAILHFWRQGIQNAIEIQSLTKIPISTICQNLKKIQDTGDIKHKGGNGRIKKIMTNASRAIGQYIRRQPSISAGSVADKLKDIGVDVSRSTVSKHLVNLGY